MTHIIEVNGIRLYSYHGCMEEEGLIGGNYIVDVHINTDFTAAAASDNLTQTIDYVQINSLVSEEMAVRSKLIEHVGQRIINRVKKVSPSIKTVKIKITKLCPPINGDVENVAIIIEE